MGALADGKATSNALRPRMSIIDLVPDFLSFWEEAQDRPLEEQLRLWRKPYEGKHRAIFDVYFLSWGSRKRLPEAFRRYPEG